MADALDSGSSEGNLVQVRLLLSASRNKKDLEAFAAKSFFVHFIKASNYLLIYISFYTRKYLF